MVDPGGFAVFEWGEKIPLVGQWHRSRGLWRDRRLVFWIEQSEADEWTFEQLQALLGRMVDTGEPVPTALQRWAFEVAVGRRTAPRRTGPKSDRTRDARTAGAVEFLKSGGRSQRAATKVVADALGVSYEAAESARRRGRRVGRLKRK